MPKSFIPYPHELFAIRAGTLRQIWRPMKKQPEKCNVAHPMRWPTSLRDKLDAEQGWEYVYKNGVYHCAESTLRNVLTDLAPYQPGDILAVKETAAYLNLQGWAWHFKIDEPTLVDALIDKKWTTARSVPLTAVRFRLKVTGVAIKRVQEMTEEDARAWGVPVTSCGGCGAQKIEDRCIGCLHRFHLDGAVALWDARCAKRGMPWASNPWCYVTNVEKAERPEAS